MDQIPKLPPQGFENREHLSEQNHDFQKKTPLKFDMEPKNHPLFQRKLIFNTAFHNPQLAHIEDPDANELAGPVGCGANVGILAETKGSNILNELRTLAPFL